MVWAVEDGRKLGSWGPRSEDSSAGTCPAFKKLLSGLFC